MDGAAAGYPQCARLCYRGWQSRQGDQDEEIGGGHIGDKVAYTSSRWDYTSQAKLATHSLVPFSAFHPPHSLVPFSTSTVHIVEIGLRKED